jgi:putative two-component system response regulator
MLGGAMISPLAAGFVSSTTDEHKLVVRLILASLGKDAGTVQHAIRVAAMSAFLLLADGGTPSCAEELFWAASLHDIGKLYVPDTVLMKPGALSHDEWRIMREHPVAGASILEGSNSPLLQAARLIALYHHERMDGDGYPFGLQAEAIPRYARIVAIVDCYDALRSKRAYKDPVSVSETLRIISEGSDSRFDRDFVKILLDRNSDVERVFLYMTSESEWLPGNFSNLLKFMEECLRKVQVIFGDCKVRNTRGRYEKNTAH